MDGASQNEEFKSEEETAMVDDVVMNLSNKSSKNAVNNRSGGDFAQWTTSNGTAHTSNDHIDSSALQRLAEAAEWKQVGKSKKLEPNYSNVA